MTGVQTCALPISPRSLKYPRRKEVPLIDFCHIPVSIIKRSEGRSAVAAAAYRSGTKLTNEWDGLTHDYTRKGGVVHAEIMLPAHAPRSFADRSTLWNSVEQIEKARDSQLAREIEAALPRELSREQQLALVRAYVRDNFVDKGMCADFAIHDKGTGNPHVHIMLTVRPLKENGAWGAKCRKAYDLDENGQRKVKRLLENPRYTGRDGYPVLVGETVFQAVQEKIQAKADSYVHKNVNPVNRLKPMLRCSACNGRLLGASGQREEEGVLHLKCERCGTAVAIGQRELMREVVRGWENKENTELGTYVPSAEVIRLTNLVNRELEQPEDPEQVIALIMKAAAVRYDCCTIALQYRKRNRLTEVDWKHFGQAVSYITISAENDVTLYFQ